MWKLTPWGQTRAGVTGVPWRDLTDDEFAAAEALFEPGVLRARGYFRQGQPSRGRRAVRTPIAIPTIDDSAEPETPAEEKQP